MPREDSVLRGSGRPLAGGVTMPGRYEGGLMASHAVASDAQSRAVAGVAPDGSNREL
jgi:hypothetical protein